MIATGRRISDYVVESASPESNHYAKFTTKVDMKQFFQGAKRLKLSDEDLKEFMEFVDNIRIAEKRC